MPLVAREPLLAPLALGGGPPLHFAGDRRFQSGIFRTCGLESPPAPQGVMGKRAALTGEKAVEAGLDLRSWGVEPDSRALTGERLGLEELSFGIAWRAA